ncbi:MAG: phosphopantothenoylcysteine decarboxylase [Candidatus Omnitrophota bacterium]
MGLQGKRILITAGPTWVAIDSVRVISNIATGKTGILLARKALSYGARVTLLLGAGAGVCALSGNQAKGARFNKMLRVVRFRFFDELKNILSRELKKNAYDIVIHSAAVSDFKAKSKSKAKLSSGREHILKLVPLEKLAVLIRCLASEALLIMFKLESGITDKALIQRAKNAREKNRADLIIANRLNPYRAYIIDRNGIQTYVGNKKELSEKLIKQLAAFN